MWFVVANTGMISLRLYAFRIAHMYQVRLLADIGD